jgi:MoaA/NifB/PqqE/SkfB family radical SAM enzyme
MAKKNAFDKSSPAPENKNKKTLLVLTGFSCNNNCIVCSVRTKEASYPDRSYQEIAAEMEEKRQEGFESIEFTGGEPSIRKDIIQLVSRAKELGYQQIGFSTNGRLFSYPEFCQKIVRAGLNRVTFSLLSHQAEIHNAITRTPESFSEIMAGLKNAQKFPDVHLNVSSVISRLNFRNLRKFGEFISSLGISHWYLLDLIPDGNAQIHYPNLVVGLNALAKELNGLSEIAGDFIEFGFFDFPFCLFKPELRKKKNVCFVNAKMRMEITQQVGYNPKRISLDDQGVYSDVYRMNIDVCKKCKFYRECGGLWKVYLDLYGSQELINLAQKNSCL